MSPPRPSPRDRRVELGLAALLVLLVALVFGRSARFEFLNYDDRSYVTPDSPVRAGLTADNVAWAFGGSFHSSNWHPLTWLSHMLDVELFGLDAGAHHLVNVALHALGTVLLFLFLARATGARAAAFLAAGLFALHPLRAESVAWISERKDVLSGCLFFLLLVVYARHARRPGALTHVALLLVLALGLSAKPMLVTAPCVLLLLDVWPLGRWQPGARRTLLLEKLPLFLLAAVSSAITLVAQSAGGAVSSIEALPFVVRAANAAAAVLAYLRLTVAPVGLACFYPHPALVPGDPWLALWLPALAGTLVVAAVSWFACARARRGGPLFSGWFWFLGMLAPVIGLVQVGSQAYADRYTYLPHAGLFTGAVFGARELVRSRPELRPALSGLGALALSVCGVLAYRQVGTWRTSETVAERALEVTRSNYVAHTNLGLVREERRDFAGAEAEFRAALAILPGFFEAHFNLGVALQNQGRDDEARASYATCLAKRPGDPRTLACLALLSARAGEPGARAELEQALAREPAHVPLLLELARLALEAREPARAAEYARRALAVEPDSVPAELLAGRALADQGDPRAAIAHFQRARSLAPADAEACFRLAATLADTGALDQALPLAEEALERDPKSPSTLVLAAKLHAARLELGRTRELLERALAIDPGHAGANALLGYVLLQSRQFDEAERALRTAIARDPEDPEPENNLGFLLERTGRLAEAATTYADLLARHADSPFAFTAARGLASLRASAPDDALRDGDEALRWAQFALEGPEARDLALDVLAAALAEAGRFDEAQEAEQRAIEVASSPGLRKGFEARLALYREGRPFRRER